MREPYTAVGYLASRVPLVSMLHLVHPEDDGATKKVPGASKSVSAESCGASFASKEELVWTAWDICDGEEFVVEIKLN